MGKQNSGIKFPEVLKVGEKESETKTSERDLT